MTIIDSSGWLEYFAGGTNAAFFAEAIKNNRDIIVPTIILYELWKKISREKGENKAIELVAQLKRYKIVPLDENLSISAAKISGEYKIAMADSIIYATAKKYKAALWTQDADFKNLEDVKYKRKADGVRTL
ncbi:MAG: type II toxin-antitoxin system VapC family toxin [Candidatus Aminicenantes bacterium]|nr:type II toxin-antitoxin system VapC family toxin [Candidatus Aminicenantes bacterium]